MKQRLAQIIRLYLAN